MPLLAALAAWPAIAADRWQEAGSGAVAILPEPIDARGITRGSLYCAEQRWHFFLHMDQDAGASGAPARIVIGDDAFESIAESISGGVQIPVDGEALAPLKAASRLAIAIGEKGAIARAAFSLRDSRKIIEAVAPRCSQIDMSAYEPIALSAVDPGVEEARPLMAEEAALFRAETGREAELAAASIDAGEGRKLLFASLCGSTRYYGVSGCTMRGFASEPAQPDWREVYSTDGVWLFTDPNALSTGWPVLVTLPMVDGLERDFWVWNGAEYQNRDAELVAEEPEETAGIVAGGEEGDGAR